MVEFYHSLMRRDSRRESGNGASGTAESAGPATAAKDMIGEIENRSTHLLAVIFFSFLTVRRITLLPLSSKGHSVSEN